MEDIGIVAFLASPIERRARAYIIRASVPLENTNYTPLAHRVLLGVYDGDYG